MKLTRGEEFHANRLYCPDGGAHCKKGCRAVAPHPFAVSAEVISPPHLRAEVSVVEAAKKNDQDGNNDNNPEPLIVSIADTANKV